MNNRKVKTIVVLMSGIFLFSSCSTLIDGVREINYMLKYMRLEKKTTTTYFYQTQRFLYDDAIYFPCIVNGMEDTLFFDTGGMGKIMERVNNDTVLKIRPIRKVRFKTATNTIEQKSGMSILNITTPWQKSEKLIGEILYNNVFDAPACMGESSKLNKKMASMDFMTAKNQTLLINFSDTTITLLDSNMVYDTTDYIRLNAYFKLAKKYPIVRLDIDDTIYDFYFDTGSNANLILGDSGMVAKENDRILFGYLGKDISGNICDSVICRMSTVKMDNEYSCQEEIMHIKSFNHNNMGMQFISHYDWILDRNNSKIYAKLIRPHDADNISDGKTFYKVGVVEDRLEIVTHRLGQDSLLPIGTVVKSVGGVAITSENICEYKDMVNKMLNKDGKWWVLDIVFEEKNEAIFEF